MIDASNMVSTVTTLINSNVTDTIVGTVVITNAARLRIDTNQSLTVNGSWENTATFIGTDAGATVTLASTNAATVRGHNPFYNLVCTNAGKALAFEDGKTNTVAGTLTLANVTLDSTSGSASWYLKASGNMHSVSNVTVGRADARPGAAIEAYDSTDQGGNFKWVFAESGFWTNTWTGTADTDWGNTNNWSLNRATVLPDTVVIPTNSYGNYPLLDFDKHILALSISNGASMGLNGYDLTVGEDTRVAGTLAAVGQAILTFGGDLDFSGGGTFSPASSTVLLSGTNQQSVVSAGNTFYQLTISESTKPVTFADAIEATNIVNQGGPVTFEGSVTVASSFQTQGTNVNFCGAVTASGIHNTDGALVFSDTLTATAFYSSGGALVFSGTVATVTFTNWAGNATFHDALSTRTFYCAPGGMNLTFEDGKTVTVGNFELYGSGDNLILLRSSAASSWLLNVTNSATVRHVDVQYSDADAGEMIMALASTNSGNNSNWDFGDPYQTWVGAASSVFTNENNWAPVGMPDTNAHLLIDGYYTTAPILSGVATVAQVIVGGSVTTATLTVNGHLTSLGDMEVQPKGTITHSANSTTAAGEKYKVILNVVSNLTIDDGGQINVDARGYTYNNGPGRGPVPGAGAGSYGGRGAGIPGSTYGSITAPTNIGSGGWTGSGGGAVRLIVAGTTTVNGVISAAGGLDTSGGSGGSGGSVFLTTGALMGNGTLRADGNGTGKSGGGGRVAVVLTNSTDFNNVKIQAYSGMSVVRAAAGTVYLETAAQGPGQGTLLIDADDRVATVTALISDQVTDTVVGTVIITNKAIFKVAANQTLTVNGSWQNTATFVGTNTGATVILAGASDATVRGNNAFCNLTAGASGKTILFEAGKTNTVNGMLIFQDNTTLRSTLDGTQWWLELSVATGSQDVGGVKVKDSNASGGQTIMAGTGSRDLKNNENWWIPSSGSMIMIR